MTVTTKDGHVFVTAEQGNYVGLADESVFGKSLSLGLELTAADCIEKPIEEWPAIDMELENTETDVDCEISKNK